MPEGINDTFRMKTITESVVTAMDGTNKELYPYLPYIFQDIWEIGADPDVIIKLIKKHSTNCTNLEVLDLGCGKGAVSIKISKSLGCKCYGIDAVPEFISFARKKAIEFEAEHLCTFETGDIREKVKELSGYDIIILGSIGPVFGDYYATLTTLSRCIHKNGIFIIDDSYIENHSDYTHQLIQKKDAILQQIDSAGMQLTGEEIIKKENIRDSNDYMFVNLKKRCNELIDKYPDKKDLFVYYIQKQITENDVLENKVICATLVISNK